MIGFPRQDGNMPFTAVIATILPSFFDRESRGRPGVKFTAVNGQSYGKFIAVNSTSSTKFTVPLFLPKCLAS